MRNSPEVTLPYKRRLTLVENGGRSVTMIIFKLKRAEEVFLPADMFIQEGV
jgi:hypothetical protein